MFTRRNFLKKTAFVAGTLPIIKNFSFPKFAGGKGTKPLVISTWDFGMPANAEAWKILNNGGRALDAVESGVKIPEADPKVNSVGYGGLPDRDGHVTLDACIMDENFNCGSVMCIENIMHPISVARLVMEKTPHIILVGKGAKQFALDNGFKEENLLTPESEKAWKEWLKTGVYKPWEKKENHDTIGMIAIDGSGNLSGACTTSGLKYKMHGRVGDSPVIGAALYVDNEVGAATATGVGEEVIRVAGAHTIIELMRQGNSPQDACKGAIERIIKIKKEKAKEIQVGFLALNRNGEYGAYAIQRGFMYAVYSETEQNIMKEASCYIN
jgi:N4-(beta-N-acetylglucosaminyl)-L-asparaginase